MRDVSQSLRTKRIPTSSWNTLPRAGPPASERLTSSPFKDLLLSKQIKMGEKTKIRAAVKKSDRRELHKGRRAPANERHDNHSPTGRRGGLVQAAQKVCTGASTATKCTKTHRLRIGCSAQSVASGTTGNVAMTNLYVTFVCN